MSEQTNRTRRYEAGGIAFVGCLFLGIGLGFLYDEVVVGTLLGLGGGFVAMALFRAFTR